MNDFADLLNGLEDNTIVSDETIIEPVQNNIEETETEKQTIIEPPHNINNTDTFFNIEQFANELKQFSEQKNKEWFRQSTNITAYSVAHDCIGTTVKKLLNHPVKSFESKWLPIFMRSELGKAIHNFIQGYTNQFTEIECALKVPSIRFSGIADALINKDVLVEIKGCPYSDYKKVIKDQKPRLVDFYQTMAYKYMLDNHFSELKNPGVSTRTPPPKYDGYNIRYLQYIYVAHDMISSDVGSISEGLKLIKEVKQSLSSKYNKFFFITTLVIDTHEFDTSPYTKFIKDKIDAINYYVNNNKLPSVDDPFVDTKKCFFCLYQDSCELK